MSLASDVAAVITAALPGEVVIFYHHEPPKPDNCLTLYDVGGAGAVQTFAGATFDVRTVQVRVRDASATNAEARIEALYAAFKSVRATGAFVSIVASSPPFAGYAQDLNNRTIASLNLRCTYGA